MDNFTADLERPLKRPVDLHDSIMLWAPSEKLRNKKIQLGSRLGYSDRPCSQLGQITAKSVNDSLT